jgi:hypothetical protein
MKIALAAILASSAISAFAAVGTGLASGVGSVPLPSEWLMLTIGFVLVGASRRGITTRFERLSA